MNGPRAESTGCSRYSKESFSCGTVGRDGNSVPGLAESWQMHKSSWTSKTPCRGPRSEVVVGTHQALTTSAHRGSLKSKCAACREEDACAATVLGQAAGSFVASETKRPCGKEAHRQEYFWLQKRTRANAVEPRVWWYGMSGIFLFFAIKSNSI